MATETQIKKFIAEIAPIAQKAYKTLGKVKPSVCIGMACVESAYGTAGSCKHHSYFGQKVGTGKTATKYWDKKYFTSGTKEEYTVGVHTTIKAMFRAYSSMEQCVFNFYELLNSKLYARVTDTYYDTQMKQIKMCGYMTSSTEVNSVLRIIQKYNLTQYDNTNELTLTPKYKVGQQYTLHNNMYVRETPGGKDLDIFNKGTKIICEGSTVHKGGTWVKCKSGWICGIGVSGKIYVS